MRKTVLITGASRGIGAATAELFNEKGYNVIVNYNKSIDDANNLVLRLNENGGNATAIQADVADFFAVEAMVKAAIKKYKRIDVLVCNAGVSLFALAETTTQEQYDFVMNTNVRGVFNVTKALIPYLVNEQKGSIVVVSSVLGEDGASCESVYSMSKGAISAYAKALAKELGLSGIRVNILSPGMIDTEMNARLTQTEKEELALASLLKRIGTPKEVAEGILFLAEHEYITGFELVVDGGIKI